MSPESQAVTEQGEEGEGRSRRMLVAGSKRVKEAGTRGTVAPGDARGLVVRKRAEDAERGFWSRPRLPKPNGGVSSRMCGIWRPACPWLSWHLEASVHLASAFFVMFLVLILGIRLCVKEVRGGFSRPEWCVQWVPVGASEFVKFGGCSLSGERPTRV